MERSPGVDILLALAFAGIGLLIGALLFWEMVDSLFWQ